MSVSFLGSNLATPVSIRDSAKLFLWDVLDDRVFKNEFLTADDLWRNVTKHLLQFLLPCWPQYLWTRGSVMTGYDYVPRGKTAIGKMMLNPVVLHVKISPDFFSVMGKQFDSSSKSVILYCTILETRMHDPHLSSSLQYCERLFRGSFHTQVFLTCWYIWLM
jgi:hypothetical protein